jgi:arabinose-5-phosphate isomerase
MNKSNIIKKGKEVLNIEAGAIRNLSKGLDQNFIKAVNLIIKLEGKLILSGVGKVEI